MIVTIENAREPGIRYVYGISVMTRAARARACKITGGVAGAVRIAGAIGHAGPRGASRGQNIKINMRGCGARRAACWLSQSTAGPSPSLYPLIPMATGVVSASAPNQARCIFQSASAACTTPLPTRSLVHACQHAPADQSK